MFPFTIRTSLFISLLILSLLYLQDLEPPLARAGPFHLTHDVTGLTTPSDLPQIPVLGTGFPGHEDLRWVGAPAETDAQSGEFKVKPGAGSQVSPLADRVGLPEGGAPQNLGFSVSHWRGSIPVPNPLTAILASETGNIQRRFRGGRDIVLFAPHVLLFLF